MWGANAVNGIINIITKDAKDTQGLYLTGSAGTYQKVHGAIRYGGEIGENISYRVYAQHTNRDHTFLPTGEEIADEFRRTHGGFRIDWNPSEDDNLMFQANLYDAKEQTLPSSSTLGGKMF